VAGQVGLGAQQVEPAMTEPVAGIVSEDRPPVRRAASAVTCSRRGDTMLFIEGPIVRGRAQLRAEAQTAVR
jgi:hypothetical protein